MSDKKRKTVIEQPGTEGTRTTVIGDSTTDPVGQDARQTLVEPAAGATSNPRSTLVEQTGSAGPSTVPGPASQPRVLRSLVRPPMALVTAFDDGSTQAGEMWRLRTSRTTIGRTNCDLTIPHDPDISGEHAEIVRREQAGGHQWHLVDLGSTNGTFVRMQRIVLRNGRELMLGGQRFVFSCADTLQTAEQSSDDLPRSTQKQAAPASGQILKLGARLIQQTTTGNGAEYPLADSGSLVGSDAPQCEVCCSDPFLNPVHAKIYKDKRDRWVIKDQGSLNGVWVRVTNKLLDPGTDFLVGGQRFRFDLCESR